MKWTTTYGPTFACLILIYILVITAGKIDMHWSVIQSALALGVAFGMLLWMITMLTLWLDESHFLKNSSVFVCFIPLVPILGLLGWSLTVSGMRNVQSQLRLIRRRREKEFISLTEQIGRSNLQSLCCALGYERVKKKGL